MICSELNVMFSNHVYLGINKLGRYVYLPAGERHEQWRKVIFERLDITTQGRVKASGRSYRIAALHFYHECIDENIGTKFLNKFVDEIMARGKYRSASCSFLTDINERPRGSKSSKLW